MNYYPAFLDLRGKKAVVVGGGRVAERKVLSLLEAGAAVTVISPELTPRLRKEKTRKSIEHSARPYRKGDLRGAFLAVAATNNPSVNLRISQDAPGLLNAVDGPEASSFIVPSVIRRGDLTIAVSTGGKSPALAKLVRQELEALYSGEITRYLAFVGRIRKKALTAIADPKKRARFLKGLATKSLLQTLRAKGFDAVRQSVEKELDRLAS